jgi:hypothetical protein
MFEVSSMDLDHLTVTYEMLNEESVSTVEFDLSNLSGIKCCVYSSNVAAPVCPEDLASRIIQK